MRFGGLLFPGPRSLAGVFAVAQALTINLATVSWLVVGILVPFNSFNPARLIPGAT